MDIPVQDEEAVLRAFDATSAVQRLMLEIEMARKPAEKIVATCNIIRGRYSTISDLSGGLDSIYPHIFPHKASLKKSVSGRPSG